MKIQNNLLETTPIGKFDLLSKDQVIYLLKEEERLRIKFQNENAKLRSEIGKKQQQGLSLDDEYILLRNRIFGKSSEKSEKKKDDPSKKKTRQKSVKLPSERFPNIPIEEVNIDPKKAPDCKDCGQEMTNTGVKSSSERLTIIPKKYMITKYTMSKFACRCCETMVVPSVPPQIVPGGSYSNDLILDVSLSKYCDLIPIERYCEIAARQGLYGLSQNSMIEQTHHLAKFFLAAYIKMHLEVFHSGEVQVKADETPQRMLEGDSKSNWFLWGFSTDKSCYFEARNTRSGDVAWEHLVTSDCRYLLADVFSGYKKAIREANKEREKIGLQLIILVHCNTHARRKFKDAEKSFKKHFEAELKRDPSLIEKDPSQFFIEKYKRIYKLESFVRKIKKSFESGLKDQNCYNKCLRLRSMMRKYFDQMREKIPEIKNSNSSKSSIGKALRYFDKNFPQLTLCLDKPEIDLDNNSQESLFRNPVVGRKTWLGTHSTRGAETASILHTLVEGSKKVLVNPREYFRDLRDHLLSGGEAFTPYEYSKMIKIKEIKSRLNPLSSLSTTDSS